MSRRSNRTSQKSSISTTTSYENQIRLIYGADIPNVMAAFVRELPEENVIMSVMNGKDDEHIGIIHIASTPDCIGKFEWVTYSIMHNEAKVIKCDSFNTMNDDTDYKQYILNIDPNKFEEKETFLAEYNKYGREIEEEVKTAEKDGRHQGHIESAKAETWQVLIYLASGMNGKLTEISVKRRGEMWVKERLTLNSHNKKGHDILCELSASHRKKGNYYYYNDVDWDKLSEIVGVDLLAKHLGGKVFLYSDNLRMTYNTDNHYLMFYFVGVRWNSKEHRHRNIPALLDNNV